MADETLARLGTERILWLGGYPAHYTRKFHLALEREFPGKFAFLYLQHKGRYSNERAYEQGELPRYSVVIPFTLNFFSFICALRTLSPKALIVSGSYPRKLVLASLWGFANLKPVLYQSDTNVLDYLRMSFAQKLLRKAFMRPFLGRMFRLLYIGTRNRDYFVQLLGKHVNFKKFCRMPYPHDAAVFESMQQKKTLDQQKRMRFLYLGRLTSVKAVDKFIQAYASVPQDLRTCAELVIAGDGPERPALQELALRLGVAGSVHFLGAVPSNAAHEIYGDCDAFVLPSAMEPWGLVVNEALSSAKPVIAPFWVGAVTDLVIDRYSGLVTENNSASAISKAMAYLICDPSRALGMGEQGRELVRQAGYTADACMQSVRDLLHELETPKLKC